MSTLDIRSDSRITEIRFNDMHIIKDGSVEKRDQIFLDVCHDDGKFMYRINKVDIDNYIKALQKAKELWCTK